jgi:hypothetical protein
MDPTNKQIFIFLGPPKTATTAFQYWLMKHTKNDFIFLGCNQPRSLHKQKDFSSKLYKVLSKKDLSTKDFDPLYEDLENYQKEGLPLIMMEEMFLHGTKWADKIQKLFNFFHGWEINIAICNRDATDSIPSYFAEVYNFIPNEMKKNFDLFVESLWVRQYDINLLVDELKSIGFERESISIFDFNSLITSKLSLNSIFHLKSRNFNWNKTIEIDVENKKNIDYCNNKLIKRYKIEPDKNVDSILVKLYNEIKKILLGYFFKSKINRYIEIKTNNNLVLLKNKNDDFTIEHNASKYK